MAYTKSENTELYSRSKDSFFSVEEVDKNAVKPEIDAVDPMNILVFTRLEKDTGGDETLLFILIPSLIKKLSKGTNVSLALAHDDASAIRALRIKAKWEQLMGESDLKHNVWLFEGISITALTSSLNVTPLLRGKHWNEFRNFVKNINLFVIAGWSHCLTDKSANHIKSDLKVPKKCAMLLCAVPGMNINPLKFQTKLRFHGYITYSFQLGVGAACGLPMLNTLTQSSIEENDIREKWLAHIGDQFKDFTSVESGEKLDKLIAIYCSKDLPGDIGRAFIESIKDKEHYYPVLIIGSTDINAKSWYDLCAMYGFTSYVIERTGDTRVLMRGLRDAQYSMATGAYSILEARYLGINHCVYLCPHHMRQLGDMLSNTNMEDLNRAFLAGDSALAELSEMPSKNFEANLIRFDNAWTHNSNDNKGWRHYLATSEKLLNLIPESVNTIVNEDTAANETSIRNI